MPQPVIDWSCALYFEIRDRGRKDAAQRRFEFMRSHGDKRDVQDIQLFFFLQDLCNSSRVESNSISYSGVSLWID
jgi:hypothetical protein